MRRAILIEQTMNWTANNTLPATFDAGTIASIAALLGMENEAAPNAIEIKTEVVDVTDGVIGGDDVSVVSARLDLSTGRLVLVDKELGYPLLVWDEVGATIHYGERQYSVPVLKDSIPDDLWRTEVSDHIMDNGYWALLDLRSLIAPCAQDEIA